MLAADSVLCSFTSWVKQLLPARLLGVQNSPLLLIRWNPCCTFTSAHLSVPDPEFREDRRPLLSLQALGLLREGRMDQG